MVVMMDIEISCKGHCEKLSHFLNHVSHTKPQNSNTILRVCMLSPRGYKNFSCSTQLNMNFFLLINVKIMSRKNSSLGLHDHEKC